VGIKGDQIRFKTV